MDEVRCPMCSKKNPADAESCEFCGARIKPLIIQQAPEDTPIREERVYPSRSEQPAEQPEKEEEKQDQGQSPQETDWLTRMRFGVQDEAEDELDSFEGDVGPKRGQTDLLGRFRDLGISSDVEELVLDEESIEAEKEEAIDSGPEPPQETDFIPEWDRIFPQSEADLEIEPSLAAEDMTETTPSDVGSESDQVEALVPDWLARIRAREEAEEVEQPKRTGDTDWLSGLRDVSFTDEEEEEEYPESLEEILPSDVSPELRKTLEPLITEASLEEESPVSEDEIISAQASIDELLSGLDIFEDEGQGAASDEPSLDFETASIDEDDLSDLDDLFSDLERASFEEKEGLAEVESSGQADAPIAEDIDKLFSDEFFDDIKDTVEEERKTPDTDFFGEMKEGLVADEEPLLDADFFADLGIEVSDDVKLARKDQPKSDLFEMEEQDLFPDEVFEEDHEQELSGIPDLAPGSDLLASEPLFKDLDSEEFVSSLDEVFDKSPRERSSLSDLLGDFSPSWMEDTILEEGGELPHVPALILDDELPPIDSGVGESDLESAEIPSWLQDLGRDVEEELSDDDDEVPTLAKATLPPWLEAMRPIETFRAPPEIELELEEEEEIIEAAGPLAGLKGVLLAEPVVAMPRSPITALGALDISDRDLSQADILQQMVEEEEREEGEFVVKRLHLPILRWVCAALLVLAVVIPGVLGSPTFGSPTRAPSDFSPFLDVVQTTPVEMPVLLVFDYEPSYSPEMDAVAGALVEDLFSRGQAMVTLSTQPSGPMLADRMLRRAGKVHTAINGIDYLHLGYLPGGPAALQLLAGSPLQTLIQGFNLPEDFESNNVWDTSILANVEQLSDFAMIAILSSGTENARIWAEQVQPQLGNTPIVMVLSAGTEPIIRPYFEAEDPQVDGILTGLPSAMIYEERVNGVQADAAQRWNGYGLANIAAVLMLLTGIGYSMVDWLVKRFRIRQD